MKKVKDEVAKYPLADTFEINKSPVMCPICGKPTLNKMTECRSYTTNPLNPFDPPRDRTWVIECRNCKTSHMRLVIGHRDVEGDIYYGFEISQIPI